MSGDALIRGVLYSFGFGAQRGEHLVQVLLDERRGTVRSTHSTTAALEDGHAVFFKLGTQVHRERNLCVDVASVARCAFL